MALSIFVSRESLTNLEHFNISAFSESDIMTCWLQISSAPNWMNEFISTNELYCAGANCTFTSWNAFICHFFKSKYQAICWSTKYVACVIAGVSILNPSQANFEIAYQSWASRETAWMPGLSWKVWSANRSEDPHSWDRWARTDNIAWDLNLLAELCTDLRKMTLNISSWFWCSMREKNVKYIM